jgi:hypothetical protein
MGCRLAVLISSMLLVASSTVTLARDMSSRVNFDLSCLGSKEPTVTTMWERIVGICFHRLERMLVLAASAVSSHSNC